MSFPIIFNPKTTATTTIIALAMCQALCWGKYYVCIIFLNLLKNPIRQKTFYSRGNRGLGRLKRLAQGNWLRDIEVKISTLNHFSTQPLRSTGSNSRGLEWFTPTNHRVPVHAKHCGTQRFKKIKSMISRSL